MQNKARRTSILKVIDLSSPFNRSEFNLKSCTARESCKTTKFPVSISRGSNRMRSPRSSVSRGSQVDRLSPESMSPRFFDLSAKIDNLKRLGYKKNKVSSVQCMKPAKKDKVPKRKYTLYREQIKLALAKYSHCSYMPE